MKLPAGIALALFSAVLFGLSTPAAKLLVGRVDPWLLAGLLYLGAGLGLGLLTILRGLQGRHRDGEPSGEAPLRRSDLPWLAAVILCGGVAGPLLLMLGLVQVPASTASLLLNLEGVFSLGIAWIVFRENVDLRIFIGAAAILCGAGLLSWPVSAAAPGSSAALGGIGLIAAACLCWAVDNNLTRKLSAADPLQITLAKGLVAGSVNLTLALIHGATLPALGALLATGLVGLLGYGVSLICFVLALRHLGAARTGAYFSLAPFVGAGAAFLLLGEPMTPLFAGAALLMAIGLYLHLAERHQHEHQHEALFHDHRHVHDLHHDHQHGDHQSGDHAGVTPTEPHSHPHWHRPLIHSHRHFPDLHHRHRH
ncbi:MAG: DMT family transporter [Dongiaceae bacterium]